jgi:hypothetical protein
VVHLSPLTTWTSSYHVTYTNLDKLIEDFIVVMLFTMICTGFLLTAKQNTKYKRCRIFIAVAISWESTRWTSKFYVLM